MTIRRITKRLHREIVIVSHVLRWVHPHSLRVYAFTLRIKHGAIIQMEHASTDENRSNRVIRELDRSQNGLRLADGIVIQKQHEITVTSLGGLVHAPGETT